MGIDWEDIWCGVGVSVVVAALIFAGVALSAPHKVDGYYLSHGSENAPAICVYSHWTWHQDEVAYCTDDYQKALDFATKANALVK